MATWVWIVLLLGTVAVSHAVWSVLWLRERRRLSHCHQTGPPVRAEAPATRRVPQEAQRLRPMYLYVNYYTVNDAARQAEIDTTLLKNVASGLFAEVHVLASPEERLPELRSEAALPQLDVTPVRRHDLSGRPTFRDYFVLANAQQSALQTEAVHVMANSDIEFLPDLMAASSYPWDAVVPTAFALSRADNLNAASQDAWVWCGTLAAADQMGDFHLGVPGCDNVIAWELETHGGYHVQNPARTITLRHHHAAPYWSYGAKDTLPEPYKHVEPDYLRV